MRVVLIGEEFEGSENLALAMLEASLRARGHDVFRVALGELTGLSETAHAALAVAPELIGLSINYQISALTALALGHRLRLAGYSGHLTAGGEFATIHYEEILRDCPLDSLIRFDGEQPLADLADALANGSVALAGIPGLVLAAGRESATEAPARVWEPPYPFWAARRPPLPRHMGIASAAILGSRGCSYHCVYCCIAALNRTAKQQAKAAGHGADWVGTRPRPVADLADEMAHLRRAHEVRLFRFEDDCLLGNSPREAVPILDSLREELARRRVDDIGLTLKLRPDSLDRGVVGRLASMGLIHGFIGVEALTDATLKRLGRAYRSAAAREALDALEEHGIPAYFNALVIGPDTTLADLAADLDALESVNAFPIEIVRLILYAGTPMFRGLEARGAVRGNYLHWRYTFSDPGVEAVARILANLPTRRTGAYCVSKRVSDFEFNLAVARRFYPHVETGAIERELSLLKRASNRDTIAVVRDLIDRAASRPSERQQLAIAFELGAEVGARDEGFFRQIDDLVARLEDAASAEGRPRRGAYLRSRFATAGICFQLAMAPVGLGLEAGPDAAEALPRLAQESLPTSAVPEEPPSTEADMGTETTEPETEPSEPACRETVLGAEVRETRWASTAYGCDVAAPVCDRTNVVLVVDAEGRVVHAKTEGQPLPPHVRRCVLDALDGVCFPEVADEVVRQMIWGPCD